MPFQVERPLAEVRVDLVWTGYCALIAIISVIIAISPKKNIGGQISKTVISLGLLFPVQAVFFVIAMGFSSAENREKSREKPCLI